MRPDPLRSGTAAALLLACLGVGWVHLSVWMARVPYPYDLEWMEGGMLAHAWRLQHGLPLYVAPNPDFVPYVYPPGYAAVVAALGALVGLSPALGRGVALAGLATAGAATSFVTVRTTGSWRAALFAATALLGTYQWTGMFYDLVRPDTWFVALLLWSIALAREKGRATALAAGLLLAASFTMKHNAAAWGLPLALWITWRDGWRRALWFGLTAAVPAGLLALRLEIASGGLFTTYLLEVPASHPRLGDRWWPGLEHEMGNALPLPLVLLTAAAWRRAVDQPVHRALSVWVPAGVGMLTGWLGSYVKPPPNTGFLNVAAAVAFFVVGAGPVLVAVWAVGGRRRAELVTPLAVGGTTLAVAGLMRAHNGGYINVLIPLYAVVVLGAAWILGELYRAGRPVLATALALAHVLWVYGNMRPRGMVPTDADVAAGDRFVEACRGVDGPVLSPFAAWIPTYAGKPPSLHFMAIWDLDYDGNPLRPGLAAVEEGIRAHHWDLVLGGSVPFGYGLGQAYAPDAELLDAKSKALFPMSGWPARPVRVLRPR